MYIYMLCNTKSTWLEQMKEKAFAATGDNENLMRKQRTELRPALFSADERSDHCPGDNLMAISCE